MNSQQFMFQGIILVAFLAIMYFMLIKPQKKKEQEIENMRSSIKIGDEIVTIGGIMGRVVKTKDESLIIQVGADKTKFEVKRWAVSSVDKKGEGSAASSKEEAQATESKKSKPKRLGKKEPEEIETAVEIAKEELPEAVEIPNVEEALDEALVAEESIETINK